MTRAMGGKQWGKALVSGRHRSRRELPAGAFVCRCSQGQRCRSWARGLRPSSLPKALAGHGTSGGRVSATAHSHRHFFVSFIVQIAAQSLNYSEQTPVTAPWSRGDAGTDGGCSFPCAGVSRLPGALAGQLAPFAKQAGGSEASTPCWAGRGAGTLCHQPLSSWHPQDRGCCSQPTLAGDRPQDGLGWLSVVSPLPGLNETLQGLMTKSTVRELLPAVIFL